MGNRTPDLCIFSAMLKPPLQEPESAGLLFIPRSHGRVLTITAQGRHFSHTPQLNLDQDGSITKNVFMHRFSLRKPCTYTVLRPKVKKSCTYTVFSEKTCA